MKTLTSAAVKMEDGMVSIQGEPVVVLCASLFYFRIPRGLWRDRMRKVKQAGYNCIDVYFPWNFHERKRGEWDFSGMRDVSAFLTMAKEEGLWVVARPGPYICSEWDGGALPAYLFTDREMKLRDSDPRFLSHVERWFDRIMPILKKFELGNGGSVIMVQLDNELDFYACQDRHGYISALRDMALNHGISVPLIACAGQGDLYGATGDAEGVIPTCNFYPDDKDAHVEALAHRYYNILADKGLPLLVTETNRAHFFLLRLLSAGVKLLGPYNQVSGTDFGFTNSINNWGDPLAFMTSDYDFHGMISPDGVERRETGEGRLLGQLIASLGPSLAEAVPQVVRDEVEIVTDMPAPDQGFFGLSLKKGGRLIFLPNRDEREHTVSFKSERGAFPAASTFTVPVNRCAYVLYDVPLDTWGAEGTIVYSTAEIGQVKQRERELEICFHTDDVGEIALDFGRAGEPTVQCEGFAMSRSQTQWIFTFSADEAERAEAKVRIGYPDGKSVIVKGISRREAAGWTASKFVEGVQSQQSADLSAKWSHLTFNDKPIWGGDPTRGEDPVPLEEAEIYRGFGWYRCQYDAPGSNDKPVRGLLLHGAGDVVSVYESDRYLGTVTPGGGYAYLQLDPSPMMDDAAMELCFRTEIWGHSNFDDPRLPGLRLNSLKGLQGLTIVHGDESLREGWYYLPVERVRDELPHPDPRHIEWKWTNWDGFLTGNPLKKGYFSKEVRLPRMADARRWDHYFVHFEGIRATAKVFVDGRFVDLVNPLQPYVDLTPHLEDRGECVLTVYLEQYFGESGGHPRLLYGNTAGRWQIAGVEEEGLMRSIGEADRSLQLPFRLSPGDVGWLHGHIQTDEAQPPCHRAYVKGKNAKLTIFFEGELVGRIWLPSRSRPVFSGGGQDRFYLPGVFWSKRNESDREGDSVGCEGRLQILVEAVDREEEAVLEEITFRRLD